MKQKDTLLDNWNHLRVSILQNHPSRRMPLDLIIALDKEFSLLGKRLFKLQVSSGSYRILRVDPTGITKGYVTLSSRSGHTVRLYETDYQLFNDWANSDSESKTVPKHRFVTICGTRYELG